MLYLHSQKTSVNYTKMLQMVVTLSEMKIQLVVTVLNQIQNGHGSPKIGFQALFLDIGGVVLTKPKVSRLDT